MWNDIALGKQSGRIELLMTMMMITEFQQNHPRLNYSSAIDTLAKRDWRVRLVRCEKAGYRAILSPVFDSINITIRPPCKYAKHHQHQTLGNSSIVTLTIVSPEQWEKKLKTQ